MLAVAVGSMQDGHGGLYRGRGASRELAISKVIATDREEVSELNWIV